MASERREFLKKMMCGVSAMITLPALRLSAQEADSCPNIVWIVGDDLGAELGCYGESQVHTPNCDRLASEGLRFERFFATASVCSPSRSAFITGMYQQSIGCSAHRTHEKKPLPSGVHPLMYYFRKAGYFTSNGNGTPDSKAAKTDYNFTHYSFDGTDWSQRNPGQPFFAQIQINEPHRPFVRDTENPVDPDNIKLPPYYMDHPILRKDWALYLKSIQRFDTKVGRILRRLDKEGLSENTIVFLFGDNGRPHFRDKQFLYEPGLRIPMIIRYPGYIAPGEVDKGLHSAVDLAPTCLRMIGEPVPETMQGTPFLGEACRNRRFVYAARDRCGEAFDRMRSIRNERYKYIRNYFSGIPYNQWSSYKRLYYPGLLLMERFHHHDKLTPEQQQFFSAFKPPEELYDLQNDPHELYNLVDNRHYSSILNNMRNRLRDWIEQTGDDPEALPDIGFLVRLRSEKKKNYYDAVMKKRGLYDPDEYIRWWEKQLFD